jgi:hypothetical protein
MERITRYKERGKSRVNERDDICWELEKIFKCEKYSRVEKAHLGLGSNGESLHK